MALLYREAIIMIRGKSTLMLTAIFFIQVLALFPIGLNPEPELLRTIGQAVIPVCALLSSLLMMRCFFADDFSDGSLTKLLLLPISPVVMVYAKVLVHAFFTGVVLALLAPVMAVQYYFEADMVLRAGLVMLLLVPTLSALGSLSSALTLGLSNENILPALIYLPLAVPALIFSVLALGRNHPADWYLLAAITLATVFFLPVVAAIAIKWVNL
ncbi:heme exporter protein CcmB [Neisseria iguanae]|uniref:Heme exporter protein B n=2 Tax=Neisseria iguanae TaxID=90242 RepID=A0A2P7U0E6_9NEIS|nr:heme exporter protein CcmB [Neisseria iguanae]